MGGEYGFLRFTLPLLVFGLVGLVLVCAVLGLAIGLVVRVVKRVAR